MSAAVIKRGGPRKKPVRPSPPPTVRVPLAPRALRRHVGTAFALLLVAVGVVALVLTRTPQKAWDATARTAAQAGFEVRHVVVTGVANGPRLAVVTAALEGPSNSMLEVDLAAARARLRALPWVADATVARRLPDTLLVDVVERRAVALWQFHHRLAAIDRDGVPLTADHLDRFARLPLVVGAGANRRVGDLLALIAAHPSLGNAVDAATLVGERRWDLRFRTGETLVLPEGDAADAALTRFAALDRTTGLLGHGYARFDLRVPGQMTVRVAAPIRPAPKPAGAVAI